MLVVSCLLIIISSWAELSSINASEASSARMFASSVLAFRAAAVEGERTAMATLSEMPGASAASTDILPALWSAFFENAVILLGRLKAAVPIALYYNPLLDVALVTLWQRHRDAYAIFRARALPGERLQEPRAAISLYPGWIASSTSPIEAMATTTTGRLAAFRRQHPPDDEESARAWASFADAAVNTRDVLARLAWNAAQRLEWMEAGLPWLEATLAAIEKALEARNAEWVLSAAPDTDSETAAALEQLPAEFIDHLSLDMVIGVSGSSFLLVGSVPHDGGIYIFAACRLEEDRCVLRRIALLSVVNQTGTSP